MNISFELVPFVMPTEIGIKMPVGRRQDGFKANVIAVKDLTPEQAEEYAELLKQRFLVHYKNEVAKTNTFINCKVISE